MLTAPTATPPRRRLFMVLSPRSLSYGRLAIASLFENSLDPLHLHLATDSAADKATLTEQIATAQGTEGHLWTVHAKGDLADAEATVFGNRQNLRRFRHGHPCWRKITDPLLLTAPGEEMILLDPDLYFPNRFRFDATPSSGLLLMWQKPNCLLPAETVRCAIAAGIPLARHVDIGVAHWRAPIDLDWLDWLIGRLDCLERTEMHVEAIVWAAIAMRIGGGYLDPALWLCWHRSQLLRIRGRLGVAGWRLLQGQPFASVKCFHAGGEAKHWLADAKQRGLLDSHGTVAAPGRLLPFLRLTPAAYEREQRLKRTLASLGYYHLFSTP
jgi:hypothetical protein